MCEHMRQESAHPTIVSQSVCLLGKASQHIELVSGTEFATYILVHAIRDMQLATRDRGERMNG